MSGRSRQQAKSRRGGSSTPVGYVVQVRILDAATRRIQSVANVATPDGRDVWRHYGQAQREAGRYMADLMRADAHGELAEGLTFQVEVMRAWGTERRIWR